MARQRRKKEKKQMHDDFEGEIRFIVPMPGRSPWRHQEGSLTYKKLHTFTEFAGDMAIEDYQAQFLMQREYLID